MGVISIEVQLFSVIVMLQPRLLGLCPVLLFLFFIQADFLNFLLREVPCIFNMAFSDEQMLLFQSDSGVPKLTQVPLRPKSGFTYIFEDKEESKLGNWRADGYRWRQNVAKKFQWKGVVCKRYYFKLQIGPQRYSTVFSKQAISCPLFKNRTLIWYQGDDSIV